MRRPVKLIIKRNRIRKDGNCLIYLQYCHSSTQRILIGTDIAIPPQYWNRRTARLAEHMPPEYGMVEELESVLSDKLRKAEDKDAR